uniref:Uncharacterized protein n=1 Tax=Trypanosoma vivax (strain Y486) TaxID=1055687 RepID=G0TZU7_TRYVY|nr:hypothetical protein TVY486_0807320 [Trypanosoma vivax Y486]
MVFVPKSDLIPFTPTQCDYLNSLSLSLSLSKCILVQACVGTHSCLPKKSTRCTDWFWQSQVRGYVSVIMMPHPVHNLAVPVSKEVVRYDETQACGCDLFQWLLEGNKH